jgi:hypothetical protein
LATALVRVGQTTNPPGRRYAPSEETLLSSETIDSLPPAAGAAERCATCGAPMASDQRYCLECGTRRARPSSVLAGDLRSLISAVSAQSVPSAQPGANGVESSLHAERPPASSGAAAVIAGVGVLLLAMGVGVLIGRSSPSAKAAAQPAQVVSVAEPGAATSTGTGTGTTASQAPAPTSTTPSSTGSSSKHSSKKAFSSGSSGGGVGQTPNKPAPPSAAEHLKGAKGGDYEQKSKNLPNVISTG